MITIIDKSSSEVASADDLDSAIYAMRILVGEERKDLRAIDERENVVAWVFYDPVTQGPVGVIQGGRR